MNACDIDKGCTCLGFLEQRNTNTSYPQYVTLLNFAKEKPWKYINTCFYFLRQILNNVNNSYSKVKANIPALNRCSLIEAKTQSPFCLSKLKVCDKFNC
jgi:hypothetical protein